MTKTAVNMMTGISSMTTAIVSQSDSDEPVTIKSDNLGKK